MQLYGCKVQADNLKVALEADVPRGGWLTRIVASYLSFRTLKIPYQKEISSARDMPGGLGAGTIIGLNLFLILFNEAGPAANKLSIGQQNPNL